jgi:transposase-like protein
MERTVSFGEENFAGIDLGDSRRRARLIRAADGLCRHPGGTLPDKLSRPADLRAFYRLMNCRRVTHEVLLRAHADATRRRIAALDNGTVLVLHDATELDYTSKKSLEHQLGQIGQGTHRGYICHNSLAVRLLVDPTTQALIPETLGLLSQLLHRRPRVSKKETAKQARERLSRESRLWRRGVEACGPAPMGIQCVDVSDSLSDTFEYMAYEVNHDRHFVLRARENRRLQEPIHGQRYLFDAVRRLPSVGTRTIQIQNAPGRQARQTKVHVAFTSVCLAPPGKKSGDYDNQPLRLWAVRVWEPNTPANEEPLEWILLTNCPVTDWEEACRCIAWYEFRWVVEEYHKGMKTGCGIETLQFEKVQRLEPAIALISAVATTLLRLRDAARAPDAAKRLAVEVVDRVYVEALATCYPARLKGKPTVLQFYMHVARLGGHQNRKGDGFPGWLTLWRGWTKLEAIVTGFTARPVTCGKT